MLAENMNQVSVWISLPVPRWLWPPKSTGVTVSRLYCSPITTARSQLLLVYCCGVTKAFATAVESCSPTSPLMFCWRSQGLGNWSHPQPQRSKLRIRPWQPRGTCLTGLWGNWICQFHANSPDLRSGSSRKLKRHCHLRSTGFCFDPCNKFRWWAYKSSLRGVIEPGQTGSTLYYLYNSDCAIPAIGFPSCTVYCSTSIHVR